MTTTIREAALAVAKRIGCKCGADDQLCVECREAIVGLNAALATPEPDGKDAVECAECTRRALWFSPEALREWLTAASDTERECERLKQAQEMHCRIISERSAKLTAVEAERDRLQADLARANARAEAWKKAADAFETAVNGWGDPADGWMPEEGAKLDAARDAADAARRLEEE